MKKDTTIIAGLNHQSGEGNPFDLGTPEVPGYKTTQASTKTTQPPTLEDWRVAFDKFCAHPEYTDVITATRPEMKSFIASLLTKDRASYQARVRDCVVKETSDIVHAEFCRNSGEQFRECARCMVNRILASLKEI